MAELTKKELENLTGAKHASKQRQILERHGIFYIERWDRTITTTWEHVNNPTGRNASNDAEPDFDKVV